MLSIHFVAIVLKLLYKTVTQNFVIAIVLEILQHHDTVILRQSLRCVQEMSEHCAKESGLVIARGARTFPQGQTPSPVCSPILQGWLHLLMELILRGNRRFCYY